MYYEREVEIAKIFIMEAPTSTLQQESLNLQGQLQPIRLVVVPPSDNAGYGYQIVDGRRRLVDLKAIGQTTVEALVYDEGSLSDEELHIQALTLNSGRPNFMDEADHVYFLMTECGYTVEHISTATNLSNSTILNRLDLRNKLLPEYQECLRSGEVKVSAAYELVKLDKTEQKVLFDSDVKGVKKVTTMVKELRDAKNKPINIDDPLGDLPHSAEEGMTDIPLSVGGAGLFLPYTEIMSLITAGKGTVVYDGKKYTVLMTEILNEGSKINL